MHMSEAITKEKELVFSTIVCSTFSLKYDYLLYERTKFGINSRCDCCTAVSRHPPPWCPCSSWSPGFSLWLPGSLCSSCSVCGVAPNPEDSVNNSRIQHSNCLWFMCESLSPFVLEFISGIVALQPVFQQFVPAHLANVQALPVKQILFCGAMVPTLLPVRPGPHLIDAGLL